MYKLFSQLIILYPTDQKIQLVTQLSSNTPVSLNTLSAPLDAHERHV